MKFYTFFQLIPIVFLFFLISPSVSAASFDMETFNSYQQYQLEHDLTLNETADSILNSINFSMIYNIGFKLFSIIFVAAILAMAGAITVKNGQWMKWSSNAMIFTLIAIILLKVIPILFLTIDVSGFNQILTSITELIVHSLFYIAFAMFLISLFLKMLHRMFKHPKYFKWSRSLITGSILVIVLSVIMPIVIDGLS